MDKTKRIFDNKHQGFCHRCEWRAQFIETNGKICPRAECAFSRFSSTSCYMFRPTIPPLIEAADGEKRPITLNILGGRIKRVGLARGVWATKKQNGVSVAYFSPRRDK